MFALVATSLAGESKKEKRGIFASHGYHGLPVAPALEVAQPVQAIHTTSVEKILRPYVVPQDHVVYKHIDQPRLVPQPFEVIKHIAQPYAVPVERTILKHVSVPHVSVTIICRKHFQMKFIFNIHMYIFFLFYKISRSWSTKKPSNIIQSMF